MTRATRIWFGALVALNLVVDGVRVADLARGLNNASHLLFSMDWIAVFLLVLAAGVALAFSWRHLPVLATATVGAVGVMMLGVSGPAIYASMDGSARAGDLAAEWIPIVINLVLAGGSAVHLARDWAAGTAIGGGQDSTTDPERS